MFPAGSELQLQDEVKIAGCFRNQPGQDGVLRGPGTRDGGTRRHDILGQRQQSMDPVSAVQGMAEVSDPLVARSWHRVVSTVQTITC